MKVRWEPAPRLPRPPLWAVGVVGLWALLVAGGVLLEQRGGPAQETCLLHRLSGHPCPTCGSTRVVLGILEGDWAGAIRMNPLVVVALGLGAAWFLVRLATGRALHLEASARERGGLLAAGLTLLLANWIWVLRTQP